MGTAAKAPAGQRRRAAAPLTVEGIMNDLRRIFRTVGRLSRRAEAVTALSAPQFWALRALAASGPATHDLLARRMRLHAGTVAGLLRELELRGLVAQRPAAGRRRAKVAVTDQGAFLAAQGPQVPQIMLLEGLGRLSGERLRTVASVMRQLVRILDAAGAPAQLLFAAEVNPPRAGAGRSRRRAAAREATASPPASA